MIGVSLTIYILHIKIQNRIYPICAQFKFYIRLYQTFEALGERQKLVETKKMKQVTSELMFSRFADSSNVINDWSKRRKIKAKKRKT